MEIFVNKEPTSKKCIYGKSILYIHLKNNVDTGITFPDLWINNMLNVLDIITTFHPNECHPMNCAHSGVVSKSKATLNFGVL